MRSLLRLALRLTWGGVKVAVFLAGAAAVGALCLMLAVEKGFRESEVEVPEVVGLSLEDADAQLARSDLALSVEARRPHETVAIGHVFFQEPLAGATTRRKRQVRVVVSTGPHRLEIPSLLGQPARKAVLTLGGAGLGVGDVAQVHSLRYPAGQVVAQEPDPSSVTGESERVDMVTSLGPRPRAYVMPDLSGHPLARVETALASAGLRLGEVKQEIVSGVAPGAVASQHPLPGSRVSSETVVSVVVCRQVESPVPELPARPRFHLE